MDYIKSKIFIVGKKQRILSLDIYLFMQKANLNLGPERASDLVTATQHFSGRARTRSLDC